METAPGANTIHCTPNSLQPLCADVLQHICPMHMHEMTHSEKPNARESTHLSNAYPHSCGAGRGMNAMCSKRGPRDGRRCKHCFFVPMLCAAGWQVPRGFPDPLGVRSDSGVSQHAYQQQGRRQTPIRRCRRLASNPTLVRTRGFHLLSEFCRNQRIPRAFVVSGYMTIYG